MANKALYDAFSRIDIEQFKTDYHNGDLKIVDIAVKHDIRAWQVSRIAKLLQMPNRNTMGIRYGKPAPGSNGKKQEPVLGHHGCNPTCREWKNCTENKLWLDSLPCEILCFLDDNPAFQDKGRAIHGTNFNINGHQNLHTGQYAVEKE